MIEKGEMGVIVAEDGNKSKCDYYIFIYALRLFFTDFIQWARPPHSESNSPTHLPPGVLDTLRNVIIYCRMLRDQVQHFPESSCT